MEKHCDSEKRFGQEGAATEARNKILENFIRGAGERAFRFAFGLTGNIDEAKDLVQDALFRVANKWESCDSSRSIDDFVFSILRNAFVDRRRRANCREVMSLSCLMDGDEGTAFEDFLADDEDTPPACLERAETARLVQKALGRLDPRYQAILFLSDVEGNNYQDVARQLRIPVGTVRSRLFRARMALRHRVRHFAVA